MYKFVCLNLDDYYNHKMFYDKVPEAMSEEFGLDNMVILKSEVEKAGFEMVDSIPFNISKILKDNIECERQKLQVGKKANKIHFLGFAYWGSTNENLKIIYENGFEEIVNVPFLDLNHRHKESEHVKLWYGTSVTTPKILISAGDNTQMVSFHHSVVELKGKEIIKEIIFPDNFFIHIFAITLEKEQIKR